MTQYYQSDGIEWMRVYRRVTRDKLFFMINDLGG